MPNITIMKYVEVMNEKSEERVSEAQKEGAGGQEEEGGGEYILLVGVLLNTQLVVGLFNHRHCVAVRMHQHAYVMYMYKRDQLPPAWQTCIIHRH